MSVEVDALEALGLGLTVGIAVAGWAITGLRAKLNLMKTEIGRLHEKVAHAQLTMADKYVKAEWLRDCFAKIDKTLDKLADSITTTGEKLDKVVIAVARMEGKDDASAGKR